MNDTALSIRQYDFTSDILEELNDNHYAKDMWPIVYVISDDKTNFAYVGETTDTYSRMSTHLKNKEKNKLTTVNIITSNKFNKSATLDIESNLIKYMSGDGHYTLLNGNLGLANHNYYQKNEVYEDLFRSIWNQLRSAGLTKYSIDYINNSDLFKYSPYKQLTKDQLDSIYNMLEDLLNPKIKTTLIEGGAGTGKTILAMFLFKLLKTDMSEFNYENLGEDDERFMSTVKQIKEQYGDISMALVVPMSSFRGTLKKVFGNIKGLNSRMVIGPSEVSKNKYDLLIVDESHRLRKRQNLGAYYGAFDNANKRLGLKKEDGDELDWIRIQGKKSILFYDKNQSIKPSDVDHHKFAKLKEDKSTRIEKLKSQFRVKGGNGYIKFIHQLLDGDLASNEKYGDSGYEFLMFNNIDDMVNKIKLRNKEDGLSRLVAGYSWPWASKNNPKEYDIEIQNTKLKWNNRTEDWINSEGAENEVGCIHTVQGYDLNYVGVIFGEEISYDDMKDQVIIKDENYYDSNGKQSIKNPNELKEYIVNIYKTILLRGIKGAYVYACDDKLRKYLSRHIPLVASEKPKKDIFLSLDEINPFKNCVPVFSLQAAAGEFGDIQSVNQVDWVELPPKYTPSEDLFACTVVGESMNKIIPNGSLCLFRKYRGGSRNGQIVLAELTDIQDSEFGSSYTVKEYQSNKSYDDTGQWTHDSILLKPISNDPSYENLVLENYDEGSSFRVVGVFECLI
jgi:uncharacterized protein